MHISRRSPAGRAESEHMSLCICVLHHYLHTEVLSQSPKTDASHIPIFSAPVTFCKSAFHPLQPYFVLFLPQLLEGNVASGETGNPHIRSRDPSCKQAGEPRGGGNGPSRAPLPLSSWNRVSLAASWLLNTLGLTEKPSQYLARL